MGTLDKVYESYVELFKGKRAFEGRKISILANPGIPVWAWVGEVILWNENYVHSSLRDYIDKGDWVFGILHELGHNFA